MTIERPVIGQRCIVQAQAFKCYEYPEKYREYARKKYPHTSRWIAHPMTPFEAYYIGYRVVGEGVTYLRYEGDGYGGNGYNYPEYRPSNHFTLWLFVRNDRSTPIYVFPSDASMAVQS